MNFTSKVIIKKEKGCVITSFFFGAEDGTQTRDPQLGRLMLYRLSYFRKSKLRTKS